MSNSSKLKILMPIGYFLLSTILFVIVLSFESAKMYHVVGMVITTVAFLLWIIARVQLGNSFTLAPEAKKLVTTGFYGKLRHPVYYFSILAVIGIAIFVWNIFMIIPVILLAVVEIVRIQQEEKVLEMKFGKEYIEYKQSTWF